MGTGSRPIVALLQEYEKRLLAKDHDLKCSQAQLEHVRVELVEAKRIQAEGSHLLPAPEAHEGACPAALPCMPCPACHVCPALPKIPYPVPMSVKAHALPSLALPGPALCCCLTNCPPDSQQSGWLKLNDEEMNMSCSSLVVAGGPHLFLRND